MKKDKYSALFLQESEEHIEALRSFLKSNLTEEALKEIFRHAHTLKGMAATMGIDPIVEEAHKLEELINRGNLTTDNLAEAIHSIEKFIDDFKYGRVRKKKESNSSTTPATFSVGEGEGVFKIDIFFSNSIQMPGATVFKFIRDVSKKIHLLETNQNEANLKKGKIRNPVSIVIKGNLRDIQSVVENTEGILGIKVTPLTNREIDRSSLNLEHIKVSVSQLDELSENISELFKLKGKLRNVLSDVDEELLFRFEIVVEKIYDTALNMRLVPFNLLEEGLRKLVITYSRELGKRASLVLSGRDVKIEKNLADRLLSVLTHLVKNALYHGIEAPQEREKSGKAPVGIIRLEAESLPDSISISVSDDGKGVDVEKVKSKLIEKRILTEEDVENLSKQELLQYLFYPDFSTAEETNVIAGRGVGLDAVKEMVERMYGVIFVETEEGKGTKFTIRLPRSAVVQNVMTIILNGKKVAIPSYQIQGVADSRKVKNGLMYFETENIPVKGEMGNKVVIFQYAGEYRGFLVDEIFEMDYQLIKEVPEILLKIPYLLGYYFDGEEPVFVVQPAILWDYLD